MALYGLRLSRSLVYGKLDRVLLYDTENGKTKNISGELLHRRMTENENYVTNMYIDENGKERIKSIHGTGKGYYKRQYDKGHMCEHYIVVLNSKNGYINYIACATDGEPKHMLSSVDDMLHELRITISELTMSNAVYKIKNGRAVLNIVDFESGESLSSLYSDETTMALELMQNIGRDTNVDVHNVNGMAQVEAEFDRVSEVELPSTIESVGYISGVNKVIAGKNTKEIDTYSLYSDTDIVEFDFSDSVVSIGDSAFKDSTLRSIKNIKSIRYIGDEAFAESELRGKVELSAEVIGKRAFYYTGVKSVKLDGTRVIDNAAFAGVYKLKEVDLGNDVEEIGRLAFEGTGVKSVVVPKSCRHIGYGAFKKCCKLRTAYVHKGTSVDECAFDSRCNVVIYE